MEVYHQLKNINSMTIKQRVAAFKSTALEMIQKGISIEEFRQAAQDLSDEEMYEATQGIYAAIEAFQKNPQTRII